MKEEHWKQVVVALTEKIKQMETHILILEMENKQFKESKASQNTNKCFDLAGGNHGIAQ